MTLDKIIIELYKLNIKLNTNLMNRVTIFYTSKVGNKSFLNENKLEFRMI